MSDYEVFIISKGRWDNVQAVQKLTGKNVTWLVANGEKVFYQAMGANNVVEAGGLMAARNQALDMAFANKRICVQLSDDIMRIKRGLNKKESQTITFDEAIQIILKGMEQTKAMLGGVAPTANAFFTNFQIPVRTRHFIVGDFIVIKPTDLRFDTNMRLKEDYDYTLQHLDKYGAVARCDLVLAEFKHRTNAGGAVEYRTDDLEQETIEYLKQKWGDVVRDNPRRPNEILIKP